MPLPRTLTPPLIARQRRMNTLWPMIGTQRRLRRDRAAAKSYQYFE